MDAFVDPLLAPVQRPDGRRIHFTGSFRVHMPANPIDPGLQIGGVGIGQDAVVPVAVASGRALMLVMMRRA